MSLLNLRTILIVLLLLSHLRQLCRLRNYAVQVAETAPSGLVDDNVDAMIQWADLDSDGEIDFEEYKKIIHAGCLPGGGRLEPKTNVRPSASPSNSKTASAETHTRTSKSSATTA